MRTWIKTELTEFRWWWRYATRRQRGLLVADMIAIVGVGVYMYGTVVRWW